jgi:GTP-binding protein
MADHAPVRRQASGEGLNRHSGGNARFDMEYAVYPPDLTPEPDRIEAGRLLFAKPCEFRSGAADESGIPAPSLPEVAFAGRSNVGKSSLINALTGHKTLARVSHTPGRTQQLNFFELGGRLMLVDLPGYGYAQAQKRAIAHWTRLIEHYLKGRAALRRAVLLIDARHGIKPTDRPAMNLMDEAALSYLVVLTKADEVKPDPLRRLLEATAAELARHTAAYPAIHVTSAHGSSGIAELRAALAELAVPADAV